jgi:hypothetical protein
VIWQGASLDGQRIFRLVHAPTGWLMTYATIGNTTQLAFKAVQTAPLFTEFCAALGTAYAALLYGSIRGAKTIAANGVSGPIVAQTKVTTGATGVVRNRGGRPPKVSGARAGANTS